MKKIGELQIEFAKILEERAKEKETICYQKLMEQFGISRDKIGGELEKLSLLTYIE